MKGYFHIKADIYAACQKRGIRGHLDPTIIDDMVENYDEDERQARAFGEFMYFSGRVFPSLERERHFRPPGEYPGLTKHAKVFAMDPHDSRPSFCLWGALTSPIGPSGRGRWIIFAEYPNRYDMAYWNMKFKDTLETEARGIQKIEYRYHVSDQEIHRVMDRHFGWQTRGQSNMAKLYYEAGQNLKKPIELSFAESYKSQGDQGEIAYGHGVIRRCLENLEDGKPGLVILDRCKHLWMALTHYIRKHEVGKASGDRAASHGKIVEKYKDPVDALRYLLCSGLQEPETMLDKTPIQTYLEQDGILLPDPGVITGGEWDS